MSKMVVAALFCVGLFLVPAILADEQEPTRTEVRPYNVGVGGGSGPFSFIVHEGPLPPVLPGSDPAPQDPMPPLWEVEEDTYTVEAGTYGLELRWAKELRDPGDPLVEGTVTLDGRTGSFEQTGWIGTSFGGLVPWTQFAHLGTSTGEEDGVPWLRLEFGMVPVEDSPSGQRGFVEFHFREDHVLHHYGLAFSSPPYVPTQRSTTLLEWDDAFTDHGSIDANGTIHPGDDGSALNEYQDWEDYFRYALYQDAEDQLVGHARISQGYKANYASRSGSFSVDPLRTEATTHFHGFQDVEGAEQWATDAWLFPTSGTDVEGLVDSVFSLPLPSGWSDPSQPGGPEPPPGQEVDPTAHPVVVAVPDSGINPYHEFFHRPGLTDHPCTYIQDFPCDIPALELSIGVYDTYEEAYQADLEIWESVQPGDWYWIPGTVFVAVHCERPYSSATYESPHCILDDHGHGTGTTSNVLTENPAALIAAKGGTGRIHHFKDREIPVDLYSVSWGNVVPVPGHQDIVCTNHRNAPIYVTSAGNDPRITWLDCAKSDPSVINVGGAYAEGHTEEGLAAKQPDVVSYYCRPAARQGSLDEWRTSYCGTSFAAPTVAGALSKVIQAVRSESGYSGTLQGEYVDPIAGVTIQDLRDAMNRTASYEPQARYDNSQFTGVPLNPVAPWVQWGWGFYDGWVADVTIDDLLGHQQAEQKPEAARAFMQAVELGRSIAHGSVIGSPDLPGVWPLEQDDAGSGQDAPARPIPEVWIESGVIYQGTLFPDTRDLYAFYAEAGDVVKAKARGVVAIYEITGQNGERIDSSTTLVGTDTFDQGITITVENTGLHFFMFRYRVPQHYSFSIGINEEAPEPGTLGQRLPPAPPIP